MLRTLVTMQEINLRRPEAHLMRQLEWAGWVDSVYRKKCSRGFNRQEHEHA